MWGWNNTVIKSTRLTLMNLSFLENFPWRMFSHPSWNLWPLLPLLLMSESKTTWSAEALSSASSVSENIKLHPFNRYCLFKPDYIFYLMTSRETCNSKKDEPLKTLICQLYIFPTPLSFLTPPSHPISSWKTIFQVVELFWCCKASEETETWARSFHWLSLPYQGAIWVVSNMLKALLHIYVAWRPCVVLEQLW